MAHLFDTGFSVREVPWHGLGNILDGYPESWSAAREAAGLMWNPIEEGIYELSGMDGDGRPTFDLVPGFKQIKRDDNGLRLAVANESYHIIGHEVMGEIVEAILEAGAGDVQYETAGSLDEGRKVWALARLGEEYRLEGDPSGQQNYIALLNSHDGSAALRVVNTTVRIVCANTWHAAEADASERGSSYSFRHTKNWGNKVEQAKAALKTSRRQVEKWKAEAEAMLAAQITGAQRAKFMEDFAVHRVIANTIGKETFTKSTIDARMEQPRVKAALASTLRQLEEIMASPTCEGIRDSAYGLVQAAGEFADHFRASASAESKFARTVLDVEKLKIKAVSLARETVKVG